MANTCIIIPCYNEASRIAFSEFQNFIEKQTDIDLYFVNDGSTDDTQNIINSLAKLASNTKALHLAKNVGKAEAIRQAVLQLDAAYKRIGYLDADLSTSLQEIERLNAIAIKNNKPFVMGSRVKLVDTQIDRRLKRHYSGRIIATYIDTFILKLGIYDTQCGAKIIEYRLAKDLFKQPFKTKWLFDVELILRAKLSYGTSYCLDNITEIPLKTWKDIGKSKITGFDIMKLPIDFFKIHKHYR